MGSSTVHSSAKRKRADVDVKTESSEETQHNTEQLHSLFRDILEILKRYLFGILAVVPLPLGVGR